jgi:hypothetical protein
MIVGSVLSRLIILSTFCGILLTIRASLPCWVFWLFAVFSAVVFLDAGWMAFLNSFYEEQIAIIFLPVAALLLIMYYESKSIKIVVLLLICATYIGSAKTAYFYLPALLGVFVLPTLRGKYFIAKFFCFLIVCQTVAFLPVYSGKHENINSYHALYFGALKVVKEYERDNVKFIGNKPVVQECIGVQAFDPAGSQCMDRVKATYGDVVRVLLSYPLLGPKMILASFLTSIEIRIRYLGNNMSGSPDFSELFLFNLIPNFFHYGGIIMLFIVFILAVNSLHIRVLRADRITIRDIMLRVGLFVSCFGFFQYIVALGDGFPDITRHLIVGNYALALSFSFLVPALLMIVFCRSDGIERI